VARGVPYQGSHARQLAIKSAEQAFMVAVTVISLAPLYVMLTAALHPTGTFKTGLVLAPEDPTLENFGTAWTDLGFGRMFVNSSILGLCAAAGVTALGVAAAYGFVRFRFAGRALVLGAMIGMMAVPAIVIIVPVFLLMADLGLVSTYPSAILVEIALLLPFTTFLLYSYLKDIPPELFEAADVDGANSVRQFAFIALPMSRPALATAAVVAAIFAWNDLLVPLVMWQSDELQTLMVGLANLGPNRQGVGNVPLLMAGVTISIAPLIALFLVARRALLRGLAEGWG
jgi:ABC-type glycerol-3-phosphate transport system permease component